MSVLLPESCFQPRQILHYIETWSFRTKGVIRRGLCDLYVDSPHDLLECLWRVRWSRSNCNSFHTWGFDSLLNVVLNQWWPNRWQNGSSESSIVQAK
jgi:hypothetical protein